MRSDKKKISESDLLFEMVKEKFGERLGSTEQEEIKKRIDEIVEASEEMRSLKLENSDEPFFIFKPYRKED